MEKIVANALTGDQLPRARTIFANFKSSSTEKSRVDSFGNAAPPASSVLVPSFVVVEESCPLEPYPAWRPPRGENNLLAFDDDFDDDDDDIASDFWEPLFVCLWSILLESLKVRDFVVGLFFLVLLFLKVFWPPPLTFWRGFFFSYSYNFFCLQIWFLRRTKRRRRKKSNNNKKKMSLI